jgi:hypothetical protein
MLCAAVVTGANASAAFAGEITGNGKPTGAPQHPNSICVFSGKNNDPTGSNPELNGPGGVSQSYGQELKRVWSIRTCSILAAHATATLGVFAGEE